MKLPPSIMNLANAYGIAQHSEVFEALVRDCAQVCIDRSQDRGLPTQVRLSAAIDSHQIFVRYGL